MLQQQASDSTSGEITQRLQQLGQQLLQQAQPHTQTLQKLQHQHRLLPPDLQQWLR
jgi:hypothetical protein